jgi:hypothetical protein
MEESVEKAKLPSEVHESRDIAEGLDQGHEDNTTDIERQDQHPATEHDAPFSVWSHNEKKLIIFTASVAAFFSPVSAHIYYPALNRIAEDLKVSGSLINLSITTYMVSGIMKPRLRSSEKVLTPHRKGISRTCTRVCR